MSGWPEPWSWAAPTRMEDGSIWDPAAPVNADAEGNLVRKVRFPQAVGIEAEWMWCKVESREATTGILRNEPDHVPGLQIDDRVTFRILEPGERDAGYAEATSWERDS